MDSYDPATLITEALFEVVKRLRVRAGVGPLGLEFKWLPPEETIDRRLAKIHSARENLVEALQAVDELSAAAEQNKRDLEKLNAAVALAEHEKASVKSQLNILKEISAMDGDAVRRALGLPTSLDIWRSRLIAFASGIITSVMAAWIWELVIKKIVM